MDKQPKVLFLSRGNSNRSQMAEGFLRALAGNYFEVASAGIEPGRVDPLTVDVMREAGIDISNQRPKSVAESVKEHFGYVITVCDLAWERAPVFPSTLNLIHWSIEDPAGAQGSAYDRKQTFRRVRDAIFEKVRSFASEVTGREFEHARAAAR